MPPSRHRPSTPTISKNRTKAKIELLEEAAALADARRREAPKDANGHYLYAFALGRYSQGISRGQGARARLWRQDQGRAAHRHQARTKHADAHTAYGAYQAEVIDKVGGIVAGMTYGAKKDSAIEYYEKALKLFPESPITHIEYGNGLIMLFGKGRIADATRLYEKAAALKAAGRNGTPRRRIGEVGAGIIVAASPHGESHGSAQPDVRPRRGRDDRSNGHGRHGAGQGSGAAQGRAPGGGRAGCRRPPAKAGEDRHAAPHPRYRRAARRRCARPAFHFRFSTRRNSRRLFGGPLPARCGRHQERFESCRSSMSSSFRCRRPIASRRCWKARSTSNAARRPTPRARQAQVAFAYTTFVAGIKMLAKKSSNVNSVEDLRGKSVVVTKGTTSETIMKTMNEERLLKINLIVLQRPRRFLQGGERRHRCRPFPMDDVLLYGLISKAKKPPTNSPSWAVISPWRPYAIMLRKDEPGFEKIVNRALIDMFQSGEIPPHLRQVVQHQGPGRSAQPVPQGAFSRSELRILRGLDQASEFRNQGSEKTPRRAGRFLLGDRRGFFSGSRSPFARPWRHQREQHELLEFPPPTRSADVLGVRTQALVGDDPELQPRRCTK